VKTTAAPVLEVETDTKTKERRPWIIIFWNDDITPMDFVTFLLQEVFGKSKKDAHKLMKQIHEKDSAIVWTGGRELGEHRYQQIKEICNKYSMKDLKYDLQEG
jgi:ATP-dependent Clp protease adaptor protein ClpS